MQSIVDQLKADGQKVILLSGSPEVYVSEFGRALGATHALGSRHCVSLGRVELSPPYEDITKNKHIEVEYLMSRMGGVAMGAYGDSIHDVNFLEMANTPYAVNPDSRLRQYALKKDWDIINTREIQDDQL